MFVMFEDYRQAPVQIIKIKRSSSVSIHKRILVKLFCHSSCYKSLRSLTDFILSIEKENIDT